ncbi:hypothetical protein ACFQ2B_15140 [Streptomyces stramineus]|uniref:Uncharacterized protein n=1 Tax=Streptomyces stramineus TaxID=173861 RepID=A0ABP3KVS9_9ACTN
MAISGADAQALKAAISAAEADTKTWHALTFATLDDAVNFVNLEPAQVAGEFGFSNRPDGQVDAVYFL